jgi:glycosyltransferase involved in cell wall biosynthesis
VKVLLEKPRMSLRTLPGLYRSLRQVVEAVKPRIVIASLPQANILSRLSVWNRRDVTFISFEHNTRLAKRIYEWAYRRTSRRVDWAFADASSTLREAFDRLYVKTPVKSTIVPLVSFLSGDRVSRARDQGIFRVVSAGRFTEVKNQRVLIEALYRLRDPEVRLTLYGDGPMRETCERLAHDLGVAKQVTFAGFVSDWSANGGDVFVLASKHEGLCIVVLEAMNVGLPVVAPLIGGIRDYASEETMFVLPSTEATAIASAIAEAKAGEARMLRLAARAKDEVRRRFGAQEVAEAYLRVNEKIRAECAAPR